MPVDLIMREEIVSDLRGFANSSLTARRSSFRCNGKSYSVSKALREITDGSELGKKLYCFWEELYYSR